MKINGGERQRTSAGIGRRRGKEGEEGKTRAARGKVRLNGRQAGQQGWEEAAEGEETRKGGDNSRNISPTHRANEGAPLCPAQVHIGTCTSSRICQGALEPCTALWRASNWEKKGKKRKRERKWKWRFRIASKPQILNASNTNLTQHVALG